MILGLHHIHISIPPEGISQAREFFCETLGLNEIPKPKSLLQNGGFWLVLGDLQIHVGVEAGLRRPKGKNHICFEVSDLLYWRDRLMQRGAPVTEVAQLPGIVRFFSFDPFGHRLEFTQISPPSQRARGAFVGLSK